MGAMKSLGMVQRRQRAASRGNRLMEMDWFFDTPAVERLMDDVTRRGFLMFGAFVMRDARRSIRKPRMVPVGQLGPKDLARYRKKGYRPKASSKPGDPPRNQTGLLRDNILFWYDDAARFVEIGPANLGGPDIPGILEEGGMSKGRFGSFRIEPRPYMEPAKEKSWHKWPEIWAKVGRR